MMSKVDLPDDEFFKGIAPIIKELKALQERQRELGLFSYDRELAECLKCQLFEDIRFDGVAYVYRGENYEEDTGLKFSELEGGAVRCPECGNTWCPYSSEPFENE